MSSADEPGRPTLRLVRGDATDEEIAALLAVILVGSGDTDAAPAPKVTSAWTDRAALLRGARTPGPGAWRASAWLR
jgi:hypothetical protein